MKLPETAASALQLAAKDLARDLRKTLAVEGDSSIRVSIDPSMAKETFVCSGDGIKAGDELGAIYGLYAISEELLGIPPLWYWLETDFQCLEKESVEVSNDWKLESGPPAVELRGWFFNDEDLLKHWAGDPFDGIRFETALMMFEAALRCRCNMIIPGTYLFAYEKIWSWAAERGLMLAQHHCEALGLNTLRWPLDQPYDILNDPEVLESAWRRSAREITAHGTRVIWTLGHRAQSDAPFWQNLPEAQDNPELQGRLLTQVLEKQLAIIREVDADPVCLWNAWMEGAELYHSGYLKLPDGVFICWPDNNSGVLTDQGKISSGEGIYYHPAMNGGRCAHLSEWMPLGRMKEEFSRMLDAGANRYALLNVSNLKPFCISVAVACRWLYGGATDAAVEKTFRDDFKLQFPNLGKAWYEVFTSATRELAPSEDLLFGDQGDLSRTDLLADILLGVGRELDVVLFDKPIEFWIAQTEAAFQCLEKLEPVHPFMDFQTRYRTASLKMMHHTLRAVQTKDRDALKTAISFADEQAAILREPSGEWRGFYEGDVFSATLLPARKLRLALAVLVGEIEPSDRFCPGASTSQHYWKVASYHGDRKESL